MFLLAHLGGGQAARADACAPERVERDLKARGARAVVSELYDDETQWECVLRGIEGAKTAWLLVARELLKGSDAGSTDELLGSLSDAFERAPARVLTMAAVKDTELFSIADVCGDTEIAETLRGVLERLRRRRAMVRSLKGRSLASRKRACIEAMDRAEQDLRSRPVVP
jgi:hypothetical protein